MIRLILALGLAVPLLAAAPDTIVGKVQPEIRLTDGAVFTKARILGYSLERQTATIGDPTHIRTVPMEKLPASLRKQILVEAGAHPDDETRHRIPRTYPAPPPPPPDKVVLPPAPAPTGVPRTSLDQLIQQATTEAPDELKLWLIKAYERVASLNCKVRTAAQVPGWQKIRVSGEAAFSQWDASQRDYVWRSEKFEVEFAIVDGRSLKIDTVAFGGFPHTVQTD